MFGKKSSEKSEKNVFFIFTQISLPKNGGEKTRETIFQKHKNSAIKYVGKKNRRKKVRKTLFYIHTNIVTKYGRKTRETIFQKHKNSAIKKCREKNRRKKVRKTFFHIHTNIVTQKLGEQNARNNFSRHTLIARAKKWLGKNRLKK